MPVPSLFDPFPLRNLTLRNRVGVSPMCQYSAVDGHPTDWHLVHLGARAVGGAGLVMAEATAVVPEGRISPADTGIWDDSHVDTWRRAVKFIREHGAAPAIQLAHAGIKAGTRPPWTKGGVIPLDEGGWQAKGVRDTPFYEDAHPPHRLDTDEIDDLCIAWQAATTRAIDAGFELIEIHAAHGYLLHSFYSPVMNDRTDEYGGSFENRTKLLLRIAEESRETMPDDMPLAVRLSCSDWMPDGWTIDDSVRLAKLLKDAGVDLIDCSSGGASRTAQIPVGPGYQTQFAAQIRREADIATAAVGMITQAAQADTIIRTGQADLVFLAREMLRDPHWPTRAAKELGADIDAIAPKQYARAW